ncbi:hypothetical protein BBJ28_00012102 [Nothophytophthora sp. Chile5]|nr:hypothetical protein BBJ28_00012102 [Nothophytophthora sp. Chile5]
MQALASAPFNVAVLANLAQCFLRLDQLDDCIEFCSRALYIDANHVKALSRRATAWHKQKKWKQAAADMRKALALDAENANVLEQHSIIVGDYEDAVTDSELDLVLVAKDQQQQRRNGGDNSTGSPLSASTSEELRFSLELLKKMAEQTTVLGNSEPAGQKRRVSDAWVAYDLLLPFLERNEHVRAKFRTSGEMNKLCDRLVAVMGDLEAPQVATEASARRRDEELIISAMFNCMTAAVADTPRNQAVLFRHVAFRTKLTEAFSALNAAFGAPSQATSVPWIVQASLARFLEEALGSKSWRSAVIASDEAVTALLTTLRINFDDRSMASDERAAKASLVLAGSGICFTLSSEASGLQAFASRGVDCLATAAQALETHSGAGSAVSLRNLLGFMTNLSTSRAIRTAIERAPCQEIRWRLVQILLQIAQDAYCGGHSEPTVSPRDAVCSERALGALLNLSFAETSQLRRSGLLKSPAVETIERILAYASPASFTDSILVLSRATSLLCRLHVAFHGQSGVDESHAPICSRLSSVEVLSKLFEICQQANACFSGKSSAIPEELWQLCAQIWCHVGWCAHLLHVRAFLRQKQAVPLLLQVIALANAQKAYRRPSGKTTACERLVGNMVKVLIAMQTDRDAADAPAFRAQRNIAVLVSSLQTLADGLARKNVAILLAKLCQFDPKAKAAVRELRGIEMMLSISQSMKQAVAF